VPRSFIAVAKWNRWLLNRWPYQQNHASYNVTMPIADRDAVVRWLERFT